MFDRKLIVGGVVYTTRRSPFANHSNYRKGRISGIEYENDEIKLIWCDFGKKYGHEAYVVEDVGECLFLDKSFIV